MEQLIAWAIWFPLAGAILTFLFRSRHVRTLGLVFSIASAAIVVALISHVWRNGEQRYFIGGWGAPLGIDLVADGLSVFMLAMTAGVGVLVSWFAWGYFTPMAQTDPAQPSTDAERWTEPDSFWPTWLLLWGALNIIYLTSDVFNAYVGLEIMSLTAVALVLLARGPIVMIASLRYLIASLMGSLFYLFGVAILYAGFGTLDMVLLGQRVSPDWPAWAALGLMTAGLMLKSALFPLHFWLPPAHANAATPVSAILSALVIKASFYLVLRLWFDVFADVKTRDSVEIIGAIGAIAIVWGSAQAIRQKKLKLLVAYSTVAQVGYLFLMIPLATPSPAVEPGAIDLNVFGWDGGMYQIVSHAFAKAAMFLAAGNIIYALHGVDEIEGMGAFASRLPVTTSTFALASVSLMGLPPSGGFVAKWLYMTASIQNRQWWWSGILILGGLLTAIYVFRVLAKAFRPAPEGQIYRRVPISWELPGLLLALVAFLMGIYAANVYQLLEIGRGPFE